MRRLLRSPVRTDHCWRRRGGARTIVLATAFAILLIAALTAESLLSWWAGGAASAVLLSIAGYVATARRKGEEDAYTVEAIGPGPWRDGRSLVTRLGHPLPDVCVASGKRPDRIETKVIEVAPTIARWATILTLCSFFQGAVSRAEAFDFPWSDTLTPVRRKRRAVGVLYLGVATLAFGAFCTVDLAETRLLALVPIPSLVLFWRGAKRILDPVPSPFGVRMIGDVVWLRRVHPAVLEGLPVLPDVQLLRYDTWQERQLSATKS